MGYERNPRIAGQQGEYYGARDPQDTDRGYGFDRGGPYSSARDYAAAGEYGQGWDDDRARYGQRDYGHANYAEREQRLAGQSGYGPPRGYRRDRGYQDRGYPDRNYQGSYASDGHRFAEADQQRAYGQRDRGYGRQPQGYDYEERGFLNRAGDEVRSWFGDEEAERRRELDSRYDERQGGWTSPYARDADYHSWRRGQIEALDRDYHEYRQENRSKFETEFGTWRNERQTQRSSLSSVAEHMEVVGSDGEHIGTVDKVRGDRIVLTKSDPDAGGRHHSIPSRWIDSVDDKVKLRKTADEAKSHWRDEERNQAFFGEDRDGTDDAKGPHILNRSFSGTY
jgi:hypothetical protein